MTRPLRHLAEQQGQLQTVDPEAAALIASIIDDEQRHHDRSLDAIDDDSGLLRLLRTGVGQATEAVIWLGMRL